jgi:hypothetical protein
VELSVRADKLASAGTTIQLLFIVAPDPDSVNRIPITLTVSSSTSEL